MVQVVYSSSSFGVLWEEDQQFKAGNKPEGWCADVVSKGWGPRGSGAPTTDRTDSCRLSSDFHTFCGMHACPSCWARIISACPLSPIGQKLILPEPLSLDTVRMNWVRPRLPVETGRLDVLYDLLKGGQPNTIISLPPESHQALTEFVNELHQASLAKYNPDIPVQGRILLGKKTMLAALVQQSQALEWGYSTLGRALLSNN